MTGFSEIEIDKVMVYNDNINEPDFEEQINNSSEDDISRITIYVPDELLDTVKLRVKDLREEFPALVIREKRGA